MKQKIKIVGYPRTGNQFVITLIRYLTENQSNWKNLDDSWSGVWHSHDLRCEEKISRPIVYLCRDPITTIYSMSVANDRSAGTPIYRSSSDSENYVEFMKEYHKHLQKYYNKNNFIVKYRSIVESRSHRSRLGKTYSTLFKKCLIFCICHMLKRVIWQKLLLLLIKNMLLRKLVAQIPIITTTIC